MRTTVDIEDDVLRIVQSQAESKQCSLGKIISDLLRQVLSSDHSGPKIKNGVPLLDHAGEPGLPVTNEQINAIKNGELLPSKDE